MTPMDLFTRRRRYVLTGSAARAGRVVGRCAAAAVLIPLALMFGVFGLAQHAVRRCAHRKARA